MILLLAVLGSAQALDGNDELELQLSTGESLQGWHYGLQDGVLVLSGNNRYMSVPLTLVESVRKDGQPLPLADFHAEAISLQLDLSLERALPPPHPQPGAVAALSFAWAGAGHAALGDWKDAWGFIALDAVLLGGAAWSVFGAEQFGPVIPLAAVDLLVRGVAAGESARRARSRRRRLQVGPPVVPEGL